MLPKEVSIFGLKRFDGLVEGLTQRLYSIILGQAMKSIAYNNIYCY